jgi:hypothetical protein
MKAVKNGWEIEGSVDEIKELVKTTIVEPIEARIFDEETTRIDTTPRRRRKYRGGFSDKEVEYIKNRYIKGKSVKSISRHLKRPYSSVYNHIVLKLPKREEKPIDKPRAGMKIRKHVKKRWKKNEDKLAKKMYDGTKYSIDQIAEKVGRSYSAAYNRICLQLKLGKIEEFEKKKSKKKNEWNVGYKWINNRASEIRMKTGVSKTKAYTKACKEYKEKFENGQGSA